MSATPARAPRLRCAVYIRVSTDEQVERARLREQQDRLPGIAPARGWPCTVIEDIGISGRTIAGRPGTSQPLQMIVEDQLDVIW